MLCRMGWGGTRGTRALRGWRLATLAAVALLAASQPAAADDRQMICQAISDAAAANGLPVGFLARLLWTESGFRSEATSPAGAAGVAQFMPQTALEHGLLDPRDPLQSIQHAASLLLELNRRFGNLGLAAAAYNAGAARVTKWLQGAAALPIETRLYVLAITGRAPEAWASLRASIDAQPVSYSLPSLNCLNATTTTAARHKPVMEAAVALAATPPTLPVFQARLDNHLGTAVALFSALSRSEHPAPPKPLWGGNKRTAADSLCALLRAGGAKCQVVEQ
jgi:transglycosylase-like protein with SLT domain